MTRAKPLLIMTALLAACTSEQSGGPMPEKKPFEMELHGDIRVDNYYWLRERENPEVIAYLDAENAYTEKMMAPMQGMQTILIDEIRSRMKEDEESRLTF